MNPDELQLGTEVRIKGGPHGEVVAVSHASMEVFVQTEPGLEVFNFKELDLLMPV